ncbi:Chromosome (plasmid) partitioning protein ParB [hydrothermal vent metagenome]|uniref:Chromosome (Plasmid) partitioning protein ParB n=1 Tax=hydrothermal vent metagenome TaxID=652676 RepID=A0A3B1BCK2_9ZZZZ
MAAKKRGLGRGLDALLGSSASSMISSPSASENKNVEGLQNLPVDVIQRGRFQPRQDFSSDALQELADSIRAQGVVQPIVVRPVSGVPGKYELIAGERRWRATQLAGLHEIPAVIRDVPDQAAMAMGLIENIQREELNPIEEATALQRLIEEFGLTHQETAEAVGRSRAAVSNLLRLLSLDPVVRQMLEAGKLEMGHARALLALQVGAQQIQAAQEVGAKGLSVRETERLVRKLQAPETDSGKEKKPDPDTLRLQENLAQTLGAKVQFQHNRQGRGKMVIHYNSLDELDGILNHIK